MTEAGWLAATNPKRMLEFLRSKASDRKLRLFACGFCQQIDELVDDADCRGAVEVAEQFADGNVSPQALQAACDSARLVWAASEWKGMLAANATESGSWAAATGMQSALEMDGISRELWKCQSNVLRDIFGNPFRPVTFDAAWRAPTVTALARQIYDTRDFTAMPLLAGALQDAGCENDDILTHCRGPGPHVCGCWALDLALGKE